MVRSLIVDQVGYLGAHELRRQVVAHRRARSRDRRLLGDRSPSSRSRVLSDGYSSPDHFDDTKGPGPGQEAVDTRQKASDREGNDESWVSALERVRDHHERDGDNSKRRDSPGDLSYGGAVHMVVCIPVTEEGLVDQRWGHAERVVVAVVIQSGIESWNEFEVGWGSLHDSGTEGGHHARIARFLQEHKVEAIVANHMGPPMEHMLGKMGIEVRLGAAGPAKEAALGTLGGEPRPETDEGA